jgi:hypothetical protein
VPQLGQGFLHPHVSPGTGNPQRSQDGGEGGTMERWNDGTMEDVSRSLVPTFPRSLLFKPIRPGEERIGQPFDADGGIRSVAAVDDGGIRQ